MTAASTMLKASSRLPAIRTVAALAYQRHFARASGYRRLFRGIFPSFAIAMANIPANRNAGYDNEASATCLLHEAEQINLSDYPVIFWLSRILPDSKLLFDWGGYMGASYHTFQRYVAFPDRLRWLVNDVPAVVAFGRERARLMDSQVEFADGFEDLEAADVLLASGSLQFIEDPFARLRSTPSLPRHVIVNKTPVYDRETAYTLQNFGAAIAPYRLFNRGEFVRQFEELGYVLTDEWKIANHGCDIPFYPDYRVSQYSGFYFQRGPDALSHPILEERSEETLRALV